MLTKFFVMGALALASIAAPAFADGGLTFVINGNTLNQPFTITNSSTALEQVLGFGITLKSGFGFDTVSSGAGGTFGVDAAQAFAPTAGSVALTGYTGPAAFADGAMSLNFTFSHFNAGSSFSWLIDVDPDNAAVIGGTVYGNQLIGSTAYADFSNGQRGVGTFQALGAQGSQFVIDTFTPSPVAAVPEPATWAMMILGMGAIGFSMRSAKRRSDRKFDARIKRITEGAFA